MNSDDSSVDFESIDGDISGVIKDSIGSVARKLVKIGGNLVINNYTNQDLATLRKIQEASTETNAIERGSITREEFNALQQGVNRLLNLLETNQAQTIK